jgi:hypothetical protein
MPPCRNEIVTAILALFYATTFAIVIGGSGSAGEMDNNIRASNSCYMHYIGSTSEDAFYRAPMQVREHILDCTELYARTGHMPTDTAVAVLSKSYDATEETDNKAAEDFLTCKLGHKPNRQDEQKDLSDLAANIGKADNSGWKGIEHYSTSYIQQLHRCAERVGNNPSAQE